MRSAAERIRDEILGSGPIPFSRFMELALYHPEAGYYRRGRDPFGKSGDYFTAEQIQPVFGLLIRELVAELKAEMGMAEEFTVVELGAGRGEMAPFLASLNYCPVDWDRPYWPENFSGVVLANEFFDALPVDVAVKREGRFYQRLVAFEEGWFRWVDDGELLGEAAAYAAECGPWIDEGGVLEIHLEALRWLEAIARRLRAGYVLIIDYGYTWPELKRFPAGTLMSYRRHTATANVLDSPGEQDITSHVPFSALMARARQLGLEPVRLEPLWRTLVRVGEVNGFAPVLEAEDETESLKRRLQLKTLLFGMGETFQCLLLRRSRQ